MFRFFRRKKSTADVDAAPQDNLASEDRDAVPAAIEEPAPEPVTELAEPEVPAEPVSELPAEAAGPDTNVEPAEPATQDDVPEPEPEPHATGIEADLLQSADARDEPKPEPEAQAEPGAAGVEPARTGWMGRLRSGLRRTGQSISTVFTGTQIDEDLYEDLEAALLMADAGVAATQFLLDDLRERVKTSRATEPAQVKALLQDAVADLLAPLEKPLVVGQYHPTVIMVAGVNGAGKTTSIGKLTRHLAAAGARVLLAAADTFRAAAREQLLVWADRNQVEIISQEGADPSAVSFDAVAAGRARNMDVVLVDTAGRLPTQKHLMDELSKIRRVINKADLTAPHEVLLVIDGNTGQNGLAQVKAFDEAVQLTGLIVTKLDGSAKGGVLCAIAREKPVPVYFVGVGEALEDLQTFRAREFAQALIDP